MSSALDVLFSDSQFTNGVFHHLRKALSYKTNIRNLERLFSKVYELHLRILESTLPIFISRVLYRLQTTLSIPNPQDLSAAGGDGFTLT